MNKLHKLCKHYFLWTLSVILCLTTTGIWAQQELSPYDQALSAYKAGDYEQAQEILSILIKEEWNNYDVVLLSGFVSWKRGKINWAEANFDRAMGIDAQNKDAYHAKIQMYLNLNDNDKAERWAKTTKTKFSGDMLSHNLHTLSLLKQDKWPQAIEAAEQAISVESTDWEAYNHLGLIYLSIEKYDLAYIAFKSALSIKPDSSYIINNLGVVMEKQQQYQRAKSYYEKSLKLNDNHPTARQNLQRVNKILG